MNRCAVSCEADSTYQQNLGCMSDKVNELLMPNAVLYRGGALREVGSKKAW